MKYKICAETSSNPIIVAEENKKKFILDNRNRLKISKIKVDNCLITGHSPRCDFLFEIYNNNNFISDVLYVELKGSDLDKAFHQICCTICYCLDRHKNIPKRSYIIASRVPKSGTSSQNYRKQMLIKHKIPLHIATNQQAIKL